MAIAMMATVTAAMTKTMMGNDNNNDGGGSLRATAATDGMVWGRRQAARGGKNGHKAEIGTMWV